MKSLRNWLSAMLAVAFFSTGSLHALEPGSRMDVYQWDPPFNTKRQYALTSYQPLAHAEKVWNICVSIPHIKDDYWLAVNYALIQEAQRLGIHLNIFEAGGYENLDRQKRQIVQCMDSKHGDGLIIGAISATGLNDLVAQYAQRNIPVIDLINGIESPNISARVAADFYDMGRITGKYLRKIQGDKPARVAWFPGPKGAGWVATGDNGFRDAIDKSNITIVASTYGDTGIAEQARLLNAVLDKNKDIDYIVGTAVTAEAAVSVLRERKLNGRVKILSYYFGAGVYRFLQRGSIVAAPTDQQGRQAGLAIDLIVKILEKKPYPKHISATIEMVDDDNIKQFDTSNSLAPQGFRPILSTTD
jgi:protein TorT